MTARALLLAAMLLLAACGGPPPAPFNATDVTATPVGRDFELADPTGKKRRLSEFKGKAVMLFFGYTHCPDVCPTALSGMRDAMNLLGPDAARVQVLFVTVDPERDTPEVLGQYVPWFNPSFLGLWGDSQVVAGIAKDFGVFYKKQPGSSPETYSIDHMATSFIFDPQGRQRLLVQHGTAPDKIAADLRRLLAGE